MRRAVLVGAMIGTAAAAAAQNAGAPKPAKDASTYVGEADLQAIMRSVPPANGKPGAFSKRLFQDATYSTAFIRLNAPDVPHAHGRWSEVFVVKEGSGVLETGGTITGITGGGSATHRDLFIDGQPAPSQTAAPAAAGGGAASDDKAGTGIDGGHRQRVGPGDVILIPAGVAHRWLQVEKPIVYLDTRFPRAE